MMCVARRCYCGVFGRLHQRADGNRRYQQGIRRSYSPSHCRKCGRARYGGDGVCQGQVDAQSGGCSRFQHREFCFTLLRFHHAITSSTSKSRSSSFRTLSPLLSRFIDCAMCTYLSRQRRFIVTLGWILGKPLTLLFDPFQSIVLFLSGAFPNCPFAYAAICNL